MIGTRRLPGKMDTIAPKRSQLTTSESKYVYGVFDGVLNVQTGILDFREGFFLGPAIQTHGIQFI